jgi:hypothetical protein
MARLLPKRGRLSETHIHDSEEGAKPRTFMVNCVVPMTESHIVISNIHMNAALLFGERRNSAAGKTRNIPIIMLADLSQCSRGTLFIKAGKSETNTTKPSTDVDLKIGNEKAAYVLLRRVNQPNRVSMSIEK